MHGKNLENIPAAWKKRHMLNTPCESVIFQDLLKVNLSKIQF